MEKPSYHLTDSGKSVAKQDRISRNYLSSHIFIGFAVLVIVFSLSQLWTDMSESLFREVIGVERLHWWQYGILAFTFTGLAYLLMVYILEMPLAAIL